MAGLVGYGALTDGLLKHIQGVEAYVNTEIQDIALGAAIAGEDAARKTIFSTPSSLSPGKPDRNWTHQMERSLSSDARRNGTTISIRAGWLNLKEGYFLVQEDGGTVRGITIAPMHALENAYKAMTKHLTQSGVKVP
jgi:hypothetical protein